MGKSKHMKKVEELFEKSPIVDFKSIERIVKPLHQKNKKSNYAKLLVSNMLKSEKIKKIAKGCYTKNDDNSLSVLCYYPAYLGLQSALSFYGLWEQETIPVIITSKKIRTGIRKVLGGNIMIKRLQKKFVFGFDYCNDGGFYLPYSDIEKTFIDMVFFKQHLSKELILEFRKRILERKLRQHLKVYDKRFQKKALEIYSEK
jgi:hypothetical protein